MDQRDKAGYERFEHFMRDFRTESDRAAVILGAAKLDVLLYQLLQRYLRPCTTSRDELLDGNSPLATFSSRIQVSYRLGLIDAELTRALNLIRKIRNSFAHEISTNDLSSGGHRDRVHELTAYLRDGETFERWSSDETSEHSITSREFRAALALISLRLEGAFNRTEPIDASDETRLISSSVRDKILKKRAAKLKADKKKYGKSAKKRKKTPKKAKEEK